MYLLLSHSVLLYDAFFPAYYSDCFIRDTLAFPSVLKAKARIIILCYLQCISGAPNKYLLTYVSSLDLLSSVKDRFYLLLTDMAPRTVAHSLLRGAILTTYTLSVSLGQGTRNIREASLPSVRIVLWQ